nr:EthD domain-containing protein [Sphingomonas sp. Y57]
MIVMMGFYHRKPGMSPEEFRRFWSEVYGPLYSEYPEIKRHIRRYVQHPLSAPAAPPGQSVPFDGIAEAWFDTAEDIARMCEEPIYKKVVGPLLAEFVDMEASNFTAYDDPIYQIGEPPVPVR